MLHTSTCAAGGAVGKRQSETSAGPWGPSGWAAGPCAIKRLRQASAQPQRGEDHAQKLLLHRRRAINPVVVESVVDVLIIINNKIITITIINIICFVKVSKQSTRATYGVGRSFVGALVGASGAGRRCCAYPTHTDAMSWSCIIGYHSLTTRLVNTRQSVNTCQSVNTPQTKAKAVAVHMAPPWQCEAVQSTN